MSRRHLESDSSGQNSTEQKHVPHSFDGARLVRRRNLRSRFQSTHAWTIRRGVCGTRHSRWSWHSNEQALGDCSGNHALCGLGRFRSSIFCARKRLHIQQCLVARCGRGVWSFGLLLASRSTIAASNFDASLNRCQMSRLVSHVALCVTIRNPSIGANREIRIPLF